MLLLFQIFCNIYLMEQENQFILKVSRSGRGSPGGRSRLMPSGMTMLRMRSRRACR